MKKNALILAAFLIAGIAMYRCHQLSVELKELKLSKITYISPAENITLSNGIEPSQLSSDTIVAGGHLWAIDTFDLRIDHGNGVNHRHGATSSSTHEMYQLWIDNGFYELRDGDRIVWKDKLGSGSDIDHIVIQDNL